MVPDQKNSNNQSSGREAILCIDDELIFLEVVGELIQEFFDFDVFMASSTEEAFKILSTKPIQIVLTDNQLGETDGLTVGKRIRKQFGNQIKLILMSGTPKSHLGLRKFQETFDGFWGKSLSYRELQNVIQDAISGKENFSQKTENTVNLADTPIILPSLNRNFLDEEFSSIPDVLEKVIHAFNADADQMLEQIQTHLENKDRTSLSTSAHQLKSAATALGMTGLIKTCKALELNAPIIELEVLEKLVTDIELNLQSARNEIHDYINQIETSEVV